MSLNNVNAVKRLYMLHGCETTDLQNNYDHIYIYNHGGILVVYAMTKEEMGTGVKYCFFALKF